MIDEAEKRANPAIERALEKVDQLGVFPAVAERIRQTADDPKSTLHDLEQVVALDPNLSGQMLRVANSPFYGMNRRVGSLKQAIFILGFQATRDMAMALAMLSMDRSSTPEMNGLWSHAIRSGVAGRLIAENLGWRDSSVTFVGSLLHDIGKFLLYAVDEVGYGKMLALHPHGGDELLKLEQTRFSFDHCELGAACLADWNLPNSMVEAVRAHHHPSTYALPEPSREDGGAAMIWVVDRLVHGLEEMGPVAAAGSISYQKPAKKLKISRQVLENVGEGLNASVRSLGLNI
jgi:putative nucleotidyltransferase with HDIG domain